MAFLICIISYACTMLCILTKFIIVIDIMVVVMSWSVVHYLIMLAFLFICVTEIIEEINPIINILTCSFTKLTHCFIFDTMIL
jgi:hypothetical protein